MSLISKSEADVITIIDVMVINDDQGSNNSVLMQKKGWIVELGTSDEILTQKNS